LIAWEGQAPKFSSPDTGLNWWNMQRGSLLADDDSLKSETISCGRILLIPKILANREFGWGIRMNGTQNEI
jgi:hypothetical protein